MLNFVGIATILCNIFINKALQLCLIIGFIVLSYVAIINGTHFSSYELTEPLKRKAVNRRFEDGKRTSPLSLVQGAIMEQRRH